MHITLPDPLRAWSILVFAKIYSIQLEEAEKSYDQYKSIGDFFVRKLKPGVRPIADTQLVHPADSQITQIEKIQGGTLIQAKGKTYKLQDFISPASRDLNEVQDWEKGFFITYYLCPTDYHRVHSPVEGEITEVIHIPGRLWPVNEWSVNTIENLFSINERVLVKIKTKKGIVGLMFVGATNVGKISLSFDSSIISNNLKDTEAPVVKKYSQPLIVEKGQELGMFHMGSTVVMLYPEGYLPQFSGLPEKFRNQKIKMGASLF